jgi:N-methylhydantoinase A/oxoprolinase/acetone carboxylase beta subunit
MAFAPTPTDTVQPPVSRATAARINASRVRDEDFASFVGPAIVDQLDCTTVIPPGHHVRIDDYRNMILTMGAV